MKKDMQKLRKLAEKAGWVVGDLRGSGHYRLTWPPTGQYVITSNTPRCHRAVANARRDLERISGPLRAQ